MAGSIIMIRFMFLIGSLEVLSVNLLHMHFTC